MTPEKIDAPKTPRVLKEALADGEIESLAAGVCNVPLSKECTQIFKEKKTPKAMKNNTKTKS